MLRRWWASILLEKNFLSTLCKLQLRRRANELWIIFTQREPCANDLIAFKNTRICQNNISVYAKSDIPRVCLVTPFAFYHVISMLLFFKAENLHSQNCKL